MFKPDFWVNSGYIDKNMPKMRICIPIREESPRKAKEQIKKARSKLPKDCEVLFEIWLDKFGAVIDKNDLSALFKFCKHKVIAVCKAPCEKGDFKGSRQEKAGVLEKAFAAGADFVDVDMEEGGGGWRGKGGRLIISIHIWDKTPDLEDLIKLFNKAKRHGADVVKIAAFVKNWEDNATLFELVKRVSVYGKPKIIAIGMGEKGRISRIGCPLLGSYLTYVALDEKSKTAQGQPTLKKGFPFYF